MFYLMLDGERTEDAEESLFQHDFKRMQEKKKKKEDARVGKKCLSVNSFPVRTFSSSYIDALG